VVYNVVVDSVDSYTKHEYHREIFTSHEPSIVNLFKTSLIAYCPSLISY